MSAAWDLAGLGRRVEQLQHDGHRLLGICGAPGSGKSTLAAALAESLPASMAAGRGPDARPVVLSMDGFHLSNRQLERLGRRQRKGAPHTFDVEGFISLLQRLAVQKPETGPVYAPVFHREFEESIAAETAVEPGTPLVIVEGNYLLLDTPPWHRIRVLLPRIWFLRPEEGLRRDRLIQRHIDHGDSPERARARGLGSDEDNARLVATTAGRADLVIGPRGLPDP